MTDLVVTGGFGSSPEQMEYVARRAGEYYDQDAIGVNFREASQNKKRLASLIGGRSVIAYSGSAKAVVDTIEKYLVLPERVTFIAPTLRELVPRLLWRGARVELASRFRGSEDPLEKKFCAIDELLHHALANFGRIPGIGQFSSVAEAAGLQQYGVDTTVALMQDDEMFDTSTFAVESSIVRARRMGTSVVSISGDHCRFTRDTTGTLAEIDQSISAAASDNRVGHPQVPAIVA